MPVRIRLRRIGRKKQPSYRIVVAEGQAPRGGVYVDNVGFYNPRRDPIELKIDLAKVEYWVARGAQVTPTVESLIRKVRRGEGEVIGAAPAVEEKKEEAAPAKKAARKPAAKKTKSAKATAAEAAEAPAAEEAPEAPATEAAVEAPAAEAPAEEAAPKAKAEEAPEAVAESAESEAAEESKE